MQVQKGLVKYKDRSDIICTYGITDDGMQYYFLDENKLENGNIVVSTTLLEAVDPQAVCSHVGIIDSEGNVVVPCNNKSIKSVSNNIVIIEKAVPTTPSVVDAIKLREDPLSATKLVSTPATIKEKMNALMNNEGRFVFNDQFSEASLFDINGNNLVNDVYYSFIAVDDNKIYLSTNVPESEIAEYPLNGEQVTEEVSEVTTDTPIEEVTETPEVPAVEENVEQAIEQPIEEAAPVDAVQDVVSDIPEVPADAIPPEAVEPAVDVNNDNLIDNISEGVSSDVAVVQPDSDIAPGETEVADVQAPLTPNVDVPTPTEPVEAVQTPEIPAPVEAPVVPEPTPAPAEENVVSSEDVSAAVANVDVDVPEVPPVPEVTPEVPAEEPKEEVVEEKEEVSEPEEEKVPEPEKKETEDESFDYYDPIKENVRKTPVDDEVEYDEEFDSVDEVEEDEDDEDFEVPVKSKYDIDDFEIDYSSDNSYDDYDFDEPDVPERTLVDDATVTISNLVELNRNQQATIEQYEVKLTKCINSRKQLLDLSKQQTREIASLNNKISKLEAEVQNLENKLAAIGSASNGELARAMADARNVLGRSQARRRRKSTL